MKERDRGGQTDGREGGVSKREETEENRQRRRDIGGETEAERQRDRGRETEGKRQRGRDKGEGTKGGETKGKRDKGEET